MPPELTPQFDHYALETGVAGNLAALSSDGTGTTHRARDTRTGQQVIVRIFSERLLADNSVQQEFVDHAKLLIELDHPSITRIIDTGQHANQFFYVLEDPRGHTVEEMIEASGPFEVPHALRLHLQLSEALLAVRTKPGLLSRVWPRSLMITGDGADAQVHLIAQNLVAPSEEEEEQPEFLAPEILAGHQDTAQASLYSIGATLYYMLTGKPPYPSGLSIEDLLELKSKRLPDMTILPEPSPFTLLRQVLDAEPRNRPKSLMEWDRALQRFIRFTPVETSTVEASSPVTESPAAQKVEPTPVPFTTFGTAETKTTPIAASVPPTPEPDPELDRAKIHTQRLSVELTKRVQKELALTEQLKTLESELQQERSHVRELTSKQAPQKTNELTKIYTEKSKIDNEWKEIQKARKNLEKEQHEFLKKTQRFSVSQLKSGKESPGSAPDPKPTETQQVSSKPRFFRLGRKDKPKPETKAKLKAKAPTSPPWRESTKTPKVETSKTTRQVFEASTKPKPHSKPVPERTESKVVTFRDPTAAEPPTVPEKLASKAPAKPQKAIEKTAKPKRQTAPKTPAIKAAVTSKPATPNKPQETRKKAPIPQYQPLPGAWLALGILAVVVALGLFLAYRTFFSRHDHYLMGTLDKEDSPTVVDIREAAKPAPFEPLEAPARQDRPTSSEPQSISVKPAVPFTSTSTTTKLRVTREASVNEELRVDMKAFNNFLLIQDEEWAEVLHGLKNLKLQADQYSEDELAQIHQKLLAGLERKALLRKDSKKDLLSDPEFKKLYDYVNARVPTQPSAVN